MRRTRPGRLCQVSKVYKLRHQRHVFLHNCPKKLGLVTGILVHIYGELFAMIHGDLVTSKVGSYS